MRQRYYTGRRKKKSIWPKFLLLLMLLGGAASYYVYTSPKFERVKPEIKMPSVVYAGVKKPLKVVLEDNMALGQYQAVFSDGNRNIVGVSGSFDMPMKKSEIIVPFPSQIQEGEGEVKWTLTISVKDKSLWNYLEGNLQTKSLSIVADKKAPEITVLAKSSTMARGGSALVIHRAEDSNLVDTHILAGGTKFKSTPYRKKGYYATLIAWPFQKKSIKIYVVAIDRAGNKTSKKIIFKKVHREYKVSWIGVSDRFIDGKIVEVAKSDPKAAKIRDRFKKFRAVNETMRIDNEKLIHKYALKMSNEMFDSWSIKAFYPLKNAKLVADFGDERHYYYKDKETEISGSYHVGYDFASTRHAPIISQSTGKVVFADLNGIYGNMPMIDHGLGLYTLYGHCSKILVEEDEEIEEGQIIAKTGKTGLALGDHLHFGVLVQGIEVWPMDWMKQNWINKNIKKVFKKANKLIKD